MVRDNVQVFDADVQGNVVLSAGGSVDAQAKRPLVVHIPRAAGQGEPDDGREEQPEDQLTDEQDETLRQVAERDQETPEQLLGPMVGALATTQGTVYFTDDELVRALGADDAELVELVGATDGEHSP